MIFGLVLKKYITINKLMVNINQYIDIDSTYRDRRAWPNPAEFRLTLQQSGDTVFSSIAPISENIPEFPSQQVVPVTFYDDGSDIIEQTNLPYMFSVPQSGNELLYLLDVLPLSATSPNNLDITTLGLSLTLTPPAVNNYYIGDILEDVTTGEFRTITDFIYSDSDISYQSFNIESYIVNSNGNGVVGINPNSFISLVPSNINRFYVGKYIRFGSDTFIIVDSYIDTFGHYKLEILGQFNTSPSVNSIITLFTTAQWFCTIDSQFSSIPSVYPAYKTPLPSTSNIYTQVLVTEQPVTFTVLFDVVKHADGTYGMVVGSSTTVPYNIFYLYSDATGMTWTSVELFLTYLANPTAPVLSRSFSLAIIDGFPAFTWANPSLTSVFPYGVYYVRATTVNGSAWGLTYYVGSLLTPANNGPADMRITLINSGVSIPANAPLDNKPIVSMCTTGTTTTPGTLKVFFNPVNDGSGTWDSRPITSTTQESGFIGDACLVKRAATGQTNLRVAVLWQNVGTNDVYISVSDASTTVGAYPNFQGTSAFTKLISSTLTVNFNSFPPSMTCSNNSLATADPCVIFVALVSEDTQELTVLRVQPALGSSQVFSTTVVDSGVKRVNIFYNNPDTTMYLFYQKDDGIYVNYSQDTGVSWSPPVLLYLSSTLRTVVISPSLVDVGGTSGVLPLIGYKDGLEYNVLLPNALTLAVGHQYRIRKSKPFLSQSIGSIVGGSYSTVELPSTASSVDDAYKGLYVWLYNKSVSPTPSNYVLFNDVRLITAYDGATRTATISGSFSGDIDTDSIVDGNTLNWELWKFSSDEYNQYNPTQDGYTEYVCYNVECTSLILPNKLLKTGVGNRIAFYPYVYVEFKSLTNSLTNILFSNNPVATKVLFKVPINNVATPDIAAFVSLNGAGMVQTVKFKAYDDFMFTVYLPNGEVFELDESDTQPPLPADFSLQVSAVFKFSLTN
jgi:hypothetical protein